MPNRMIALVTGSSRGIGKELVIALSEKGYTPIVHYADRKKEAKDVLSKVKKHSPESMMICADIRKEGEVRAMIEQVYGKYGQLDVVINNASRFIHKDLVLVSPKEWRDIISTNLHGTFYVCRKAIGIMREQRHGKIINIGTATCEYPKAQSYNTPYVISKTGILALTRSLANAAAEYNIQVNMVSPGVAEHTVMFPEDFEMSRAVSAMDVVNAVLFLLEENSRAISGANIVVSKAWGL